MIATYEGVVTKSFTHTHKEKKHIYNKMLLARKINLNQLKKTVISQQVKIFSQPQTSRTLCTTSFLTNQSENHAGSTAKTSRVYYGKKFK